MDFELDEDQQDLRAAAAEMLAKECPSSYLRSVVDDRHEPDELWRTLCRLDWPGLAIDPAHGGSGASTVELGIVLEQLGAVGDPTPFLATTTQFVPVIEACGTEEQRHRVLTSVAAEGTTGTLALAGSTGRWDPRAPSVEARADGGRWLLQGSASYVIDGDRADEVVVLATTTAGPAAFVVPRSSLHARRSDALDPSLHVAEVLFDGALVDDDRRLAGERDATSGVEQALDHAVTGLATVMVGACQRGFDLVVDYVKQREQFGVPIGSFQAVKHKAVDMYVAIERARALCTFAALAIAEDDDRSSLAASMAKAAAGDAQQLVFAGVIQLHGGIGFTWENDVHLYLRRAKAGELLLGGAATHRARIGRLVLARETAGHEAEAS